MSEAIILLPLWIFLGSSLDLKLWLPSFTWPARRAPAVNSPDRLGSSLELPIMVTKDETQNREGHSLSSESRGQMDFLPSLQHSHILFTLSFSVLSSESIETSVRHTSEEVNVVFRRLSAQRRSPTSLVFERVCISVWCELALIRWIMSTQSSWPLLVFCIFGPS